MENKTLKYPRLKHSSQRLAIGPDHISRKKRERGEKKTKKKPHSIMIHNWFCNSITQG